MSASPIQKAAQALIDRGYVVVPVKQGEKRPKGKWRADGIVAKPEDFKEGDGIAINLGEPSGWLVCVDLDDAYAIAAAKRLMPDTGMIEGRPNKPDSHRYYIVKDAKTKQFLDVGKKGQMLVEIKSTNGIVVVPPSMHESGEQRAWTMLGEPLPLTPEELETAVRAVTVVTLIVRHWDEFTHTAMGALAGMLARAKLSEPLIIEMMKVIGDLAPGNHTQEIVAFAKSTLDKIKTGELVTGGKRLDELVGAEMVGKLRTVLRVKDEDALAAFNEKHFVVTAGSKVVICTETPRGLRLQQPKDLQINHANEFVYVMGPKGSVQKPIFDEWLRWKQRRTYNDLVFKPTPSVAEEDDYNLWQGYAVQPDPDKPCHLFLDHIREVICSGNEEHYAYMINHIALMVQEPGRQGEIVVVLRGLPGSGKGIFVRSLGDMFGRKHFAHIDKIEDISGKFNSSLSGTILMFGDEALFAADRRELGPLKRIITEPTNRIERKFFDSVEEDNFIHLYLATNNEWSWPSEFGDRRGFMPEVSNARIGDQAYWDALYKEIDYREGGTTAGLLAFLLAYPVDRSLLRKVPHTKERAEQQRKSLTPMMEWWLDCLYTGMIGDLPWPKTILAKALYDRFTATWRGRHKAPSHIDFGRKLGKFFSDKKSKKPSNQGRSYELRSLSDARRYWNETTGMEIEWDDANEPDLLSETA
jgi:Family of unknown function (DUF5906)/Bifunctional DNA primase/polymerase, N-terminal